MSDPAISLGTVWTPKERRNRMGGRRSDIYLSHWNRERPGLLVGFNLRDGAPVETSRVSIHPNVLKQQYERRPRNAPETAPTGVNRNGISGAE